jgi:phosphotriesterase-related protein
MQTIDTVKGRLPLGDLGYTLMHEHIQAESPKGRPPPPCREDQLPHAVDYAVSELRRARRAGVNSLVEVTPPPRRNLSLLKAVAERTDVNIIICTGTYEITDEVRGMSPSQYEDMLMSEITEGIDDSGIKPGLIKVAANHVPLDEDERKIFLVAGKVQKLTGLPVCCHTCNGARPQFDTLCEGGADPTKLYFSHVEDNYYKPGWEGRSLLEQTEYLRKIAEEGGSLLFNNWSMEAHTPIFHLAFIIKELVRAGLARRVLLSEDHAYKIDENGKIIIEHAGEYDPKVPETWGNVERLGYDHVFVAAIPSLIGLGLRPDVIETFIIENPKAMFARPQ